MIGIKFKAKVCKYLRQAETPSAYQSIGFRLILGLRGDVTLYMDGFKAPKTLHPAAVGHMSIENGRGCLAFFDIFGGSLIGAK